MGGFSDNYECGYWDEELPAYRPLKKYQSSDALQEQSDLPYDDTYLYFPMTLTPQEALDDDTFESRMNLVRLCNTATALDVVRDKGELQLFYEGDFIGNVVAIEGVKRIDEELLSGTIEAFWSGSCFYLRKMA
jgi:hypothetical protein